MRWWLSAMVVTLGCSTTAEDAVTPDVGSAIDVADSGPPLEADAAQIGADTPMTATCGDPAVTWESFAEGFVLNFCRGCHSALLDGADRFGAPPGVNFNTLEDVIGYRDRILARATSEAPTMPPGGGPQRHEIERFRVWLECQTP